MPVKVHQVQIRKVQKLDLRDPKVFEMELFLIGARRIKIKILLSIFFCHCILDFLDLKTQKVQKIQTEVPKKVNNKKYSVYHDFSCSNLRIGKHFRGVKTYFAILPVT